MKKIAYLLPVICLATLSMVAKADTLTFNNAPTGSTGPYNLTLTTGTGSSSLSLFCMNDTNYIQGNESWGVNIINGASLLTSADPNAFKYEEEAYIYHQFPGTTATTVQDALWTIFDPGTSNHNASSDALVAAAAGFNGYDASFLSQTTFYIWDGGSITNQYGNYAPQNFVGSSPVPEPSSLLLMGSGLLGLAGAVRRKLARA